MIEQGVITDDYEHACFFVRSPTAGDKDVCLPVDVLSLSSSSPLAAALPESSPSSKGLGLGFGGSFPAGGKNAAVMGGGPVAMEVDG